MDLGIRGKKAIVCASSKGLGQAVAPWRWPKPAVTSSSTAATPTELAKTAAETARENSASR